MNGIVSNMPHKTCAACHHQRMRCDSDCQLARYFPPNNAEDFMVVHKVYGVKNFLYLLNVVHESKRDATANSLIIEAKIRERFPVGGCDVVIQALDDQVALLKRELNQAKQLVEENRFQIQIGSTTPQYDDLSFAMKQEEDNLGTMQLFDIPSPGTIADMEYNFLNYIEQLTNGGDV